jgi:hypothetical protein
MALLNFSVFYGGNPQFQILLASLIKFSIAVVCEVSSNYQKNILDFELKKMK